jgi:DNA-directed RNA polymerase specialized sigma24 family protein
MQLASQERAVWLARCILPHEPELRAWLGARALPRLEVDDIVQETYAILSGLEQVGHIRNPRTYMFEVAKSVILQALRRAYQSLADRMSSRAGHVIVRVAPGGDRYHVVVTDNRDEADGVLAVFGPFGSAV